MKLYCASKNIMPDKAVILFTNILPPKTKEDPTVIEAAITFETTNVLEADQYKPGGIYEINISAL